MLNIVWLAKAMILTHATLESSSDCISLDSVFLPGKIQRVNEPAARFRNRDIYRPLRGLSRVFGLTILGLRCAPPQALC